jgi:DDE superfamily endonuclease
MRRSSPRSRSFVHGRSTLTAAAGRHAHKPTDEAKNNGPIDTGGPSTDKDRGGPGRLGSRRGRVRPGGSRPPKGRTWSRRGRTPVVRVTAAISPRLSLAALLAVKPGPQPRLIYRTHRSHRGMNRRRGFTEADYAALLDAAHRQLGDPIVLVWDNLSTHTSKAMAELTAARPWLTVYRLTVYRLPPYAHELNPVERVWAHRKRSLANLTKRTIAELTALVKTRLKRMQYHPGLLVGFLAGTDLEFGPFL